MLPCKPAAVCLLLLACVAGQGKFGTFPTKEECERYVTKKSIEEGVLELNSGLLIKVLQKGGADGKSPRQHDKTKLFYAARLVDGQQFDSSSWQTSDDAVPTVFTPDDVAAVKGWAEAMQLMCEGDKWEVTIPANRAYGAKGRSPRVPPHQALVMELEVAGVEGEGKPCDRALLNKLLAEQDMESYNEL